MNGYTKDLNKVRLLEVLILEMEKNTDHRVFWYSLYLFPAIWSVLTLLKLISIDLFYFNLCLMSFLLTGANLYGYYHCDKEQAERLEKYGKSAALGVFTNAILGSH